MRRAHSHRARVPWRLCGCRDFGLDAEASGSTREAAAPFMEWLRTAQESGSEEEMDVAY